MPLDARKHSPEELEKRFRGLIESAPDAMIVTASDGRIVLVNSQAERLFGYSRAELIGSSIDMLVPDRFRDRHADHRAEYSGNPRVRGMGAGMDLFGLRKDGTEVPVEISLSPLETDEGTLISRAIRDISDRKALEEQVLRKNEEIVEQYRRVQEANRLKSEFLANMSHELRTPLNAIIGFSELMHDGKVDSVTPDQKEYLGDILNSSRHLLRLINDILDLSKIEAGKMEFFPEPVEIGQLIGEVKDILRTLAAQKHIHIDIVAAEVSGIVLDPAKLKQVLYNFLSNALKFSPEGGRVDVRVLPEDGGRFRIEVEDRGIGIREEEFGRLFVEFQQLDAGIAKKYAGTGLGLALTKRIVESQGGCVGVRSEAGKGSVFWAILPRVPGPAPLTAFALVRPGGILVIEDDARDREWTLRTLASAGFSVEAVSSGPEALERCAEKPFDAITLALLGPDRFGRDLLKAIRTSGPNRKTPVVVTSVLPGEGVGEGFRVSDVLAKPLDAADLLGSLARAYVTPGGGPPILVVDDDPAARKISGALLRRLGFRPVCVASAAEGLAAAQHETYSAVVLDLVMPGMDGWEFLRHFRAAAGSETPVIVWTARALSALERGALRASAQAVVRKGEGSAALVEEVRLLARRGVESRTGDAG